jgi:hypothetical protein
VALPLEPGPVVDYPIADLMDDGADYADARPPRNPAAEKKRVWNRPRPGIRRVEAESRPTEGATR